MKNGGKNGMYQSILRVVAICIILGCFSFGYIFNIPWLRITSGLFLAGYLPGFLLIRALFPGMKGLTDNEKFFLSIAFSLLLCMAIALVLSLFPQGLSEWKIVITLGAIVLLLLIISVLQDRRIILGDISIGYPSKSYYFLLIPVLTFSTVFLIIGFLKIDKTVNYVQFFIETVSPKTGLNTNVGEEFSFDLMVKNNTESDESYKINCLTEGKIQVATATFIIKSGETRKILLDIPVLKPEERLEFVLVNEDTNVNISTLWYQLK